MATKRRFFGAASALGILAGSLLISACESPEAGSVPPTGVKRDEQAKRQKNPYAAAEADLKKAESQ